MPQLCFYFQLHQPYRLDGFDLFQLGQDGQYFGQTDQAGPTHPQQIDLNSGASDPSGQLDPFASNSVARTQATLNREVFQKVSTKSYRPMLRLLAQLLTEVPEFHFSLSLSGVFLEQAREYDPEVIDLVARLLKSGRVELLAETYYHSLAALYSPSEFAEQVTAHTQLLEKLFNVTPTTFRNTELIYSDDIATQVLNCGFSGMLTEAVDRHLHGRPKTQLFVDRSGRLPLLLKHAELSDDIAFRFSDTNWPSYPLSVDTYLRWLADYSEQEVVNLFMDFETFGEHQWADTGIFDFFRSLIHRFHQSQWNRTVLPMQLIARERARQTQDWLRRHPQTSAFQRRRIEQAGPPVWNLPRYEVSKPISWADIDRDLSAWIENSLQQDSLRYIYELEPRVKATGQVQLLHNWRLLQTSDHFYYMCTKWAADGDVHAYFSPYSDPYEAYRLYSVVLADFEYQLSELEAQT